MLDEDNILDISIRIAKCNSYGTIIIFDYDDIIYETFTKDIYFYDRLDLKVVVSETQHLWRRYNIRFYRERDSD